MKSEYTSPSMEIFELEENDIITTSVYKYDITAATKAGVDTSVYNDDWTNPDNLLNNGDGSGWSNFH